MIATLKKMFGIGPSVNYSKLMDEGAVIIDVRSPGEYSNGHIKGSLNIPLDKINGIGSKIKDKNKSIITCCASGMRSASARSLLLAQGYTQVYNGGGWQSLHRKL